MGLYPVTCPSCKQLHVWFSGSADQRCSDCKKGAAENSMHRYNGEQLPLAPTDMPLSLSEWARNGRTVALMEMNKRLSARARGAEERVAKLQQQLDEQEITMRKVDQLESLLRQANCLKDCYIRTSARRLKEINELQNTIKENNEFIEMQAKRLINARKHLMRVRYHCDLPEQDDSGPELDP